MAGIHERLNKLTTCLGWSNSAEAWQERAGFFLLVAGLAAGLELYDKVGLTALTFFGAIWLTTLLVFLRRGWISLLGPLFGFDLFRSTRRSRYFLLRMYVYFVLLLLFCVFITWSSHTNLDMRASRRLAGTANRDARTAENVFVFFLYSHFLFSALFTPAYVASALTEEKERNTLEALMATDLSSREIVLSKLAVRLANLGLMLLTGLPILAMLQIMGGADPDFMLSGYLAVLFFTATLACLAIHNSVRRKRTRDAIVGTYIELGAYLLLTSVFFYAMRRWFPASVLSLNLGLFRLNFDTLFETLFAGNPLIILERVFEYVVFGGRLTQILSTVTLEFITFHLVVSTLLAADAVRRFRGTFQRQTYGQLASNAHRPRRRLRIGNWPLLWKEVFTQASTQRSWLGRILMALFVLASLLPAAEIELYLMTNWHRGGAVAQTYFRYVAITGCMVLCVLMIRVVVQAALSFSRERDQQTLDSLLTCPVSAAGIVASKWLGCMLSIRKIWLWLALIWVVGIARAGIPPRMLLVLVIFWTIYAGVSALFGLWCSLVCRSGLRAIILTLVALGILTSGVLVLPLQLYGFYMTTETEPGIRTWLLRGQVATAPPIVLARMIPLRFGGPDQETMAAWEWPMTVAGTGLWLVVGLVFWFLLCRRVRVAASREVDGRLMAADQPGALFPFPTK